MTVEQGSRRKRGYVSLFAVICLFVLSTSAAFADDFTVTTTDDIIGTCPSATTCSLRSAIIAANLHAGPDHIILAGGQTYTLSLGPADASGALTPASGDLDITGELTIDGNGSTVDANSLDRVLDIQPVVIPGSFLVTINDLTIKGGSATGFLSFGGGINIRNAEVVLNHCTVQDNVTTADPTLGSDNGGGISVAGLFDPTGPTVTPAKLTLNDSTVKNNSGLNGGGILCVLCELTVTSSTISGNTATGSDGGGIDLLGDASKVTATGSALKGNQVTGAGAQGGGLSMPFGSGILSSLTRNQIVSNTATTGSGIFAGAATVAATNNWWGCNFGPGVGDSNVTCAGTPNGVSGGVTTTPFLRLQTSASPTSIATGGQSTVTADLTINSDAVDTSAGGTVPNGIVASFSGTLGTFATPTATTVAGKATDVFTAGGTSGTASVSAVVDGQTKSTTVTVVNVPPTLDAIPDPAAILEDAALQTVNLAGISAGGGESQTLTVTALSNNTGLIPNPTVTYTSPNATGSLSYTPVANANGSAIITVTVDDGGTGTHTVTRTFTVNVTSVNDLPTIAAIPDQFVPMNGSPGIPITIGDVETPPASLVVTATSSNETVVPNGGLVVGPGGTSRTLTVTPAPNQSGTATITVTVDDGTGQTSTSFVATVATGLSIADATMAEGNSGTTNLSLTVSLTGPAPSTVSAHFATRQRTAIEGVDYLGVAGTVSFAPGATTATILVPVVGDVSTEIDETFFIELSAPVDGVITRAQAVGTITNDDPTTPVTAEVVSWGRRTGVTTNGGTLTKTAAAGWTAAASSTRAVKTGDGSVEFSATAPDQTWVVGLSRSVSPFLVVTDIEFGLELFADATFAVVEHGVFRTGPLGPYAAGDRFAIVVTGGVLQYQRNGVAIYTSAVTPLYPLRVDAALFTPGATIADVVLAGRLVHLGGAAGDVDNDGTSDFTVFRPSTGGWHTLKSSTNYTTSQSVSWGLSTDVPAPGDYDGDGQIDPAIYRPSTGLWAYLKSSTNYTTSVTVSWGLSTDLPVPADYDGDGKTDPTVYRPSTGGWYVLKSSTSYTSSIGVSWGLSTDLPVPGDYDGDGQADPAIYRPSTGLWAFLKSTTSYTTSATVSWGLSTDVAVPGDYDGDGKTDPAVFRPSTGGWFILTSSTNYTSSVGVSWGLSTDVPVPADYDGDGKYDPAIFRPSTGLWAVLKSSTTYTTSFTASWGLSTDVPINKRP